MVKTSKGAVERAERMPPVNPLLAQGSRAGCPFLEGLSAVGLAGSVPLAREISMFRRLPVDDHA